MQSLLPKGVLAEWLGNGLQNHVQRFESARHLKTVISQLIYNGFYFLENSYLQINYLRKINSIIPFLEVNCFLQELLKYGYENVLSPCC